MDLEDLEYVMGSLKLLGSKGTTGTQASFLELFNGDQETIDKIDPTIAAKWDLRSVMQFPVRLIPEKWIQELPIFWLELQQVRTKCQTTSVCYSI